MFMQHSCRLTAQLMETTWNQIELQVEEDLMKMRQWASQFHLFASQQACLFALLYVCVCVFSLGRDVFHVFFIGILAGWLGYAILESAVQQGQGGCGTADGEAAYHCYPPEHQPSPWRYRGEASIAWTSSAPWLISLSLKKVQTCFRIWSDSGINLGLQWCWWTTRCGHLVPRLWSQVCRYNFCVCRVGIVFRRSFHRWEHCIVSSRLLRQCQFDPLRFIAPATQQLQFDHSLQTQKTHWRQDCSETWIDLQKLSKDIILQKLLQKHPKTSAETWG